MNFNWSKDFVSGERNNYIFDLAGAFCEYGVSQYYAENYIYNNVVYGEFSENEMKNAIASAYKIRTSHCKYFEDYSKVDRIRTDLVKGKEKVMEIHKIDESLFNEIKENIEQDDFWSIEEQKNGNKKVVIDVLKYKFFLESNGFKKHFPSSAEKPTFVRVQSNKVKETSEAKIKDFVLDYLLENGEIEVYKYCANYQNLFSESFLLLLETIELMLLKDTKDCSFIAYQNGVIEVMKTRS